MFKGRQPRTGVVMKRRRLPHSFGHSSPASCIVSSVILFIFRAGIMHRFVVLAAATLGFAVATLARDLSGANCGVEGLGYFACYHPFPQHCVEQVSEQAVAFCSRYLSSTTTATATASQISVVVKTLTTTAVATTTEVSTALITSPTSTTTTTSYEPPEIITVTVKRRDAPHFCPRIYEKILSRKPADKISSVCSCLGVTATTVVSSWSDRGCDHP